ncbi:hypothetical protein PJM29_32190, partial [Mycobacterium kansasii]
KIASNSVKKQKATTTTVKPKQKITTTKVNKNAQKLKKRKQTNKTEKYVSGLATQHAQLKSNYKTYSLYNHIRGHKNWNI